jgi:tetratricopeptide (TPR) repeat protein
VVSVVDVAPTLAEAMGLPPFSDIDGVSLLGEDPDGAASGRGARGVYFESYYGYRNYGWSPIVGWMDRKGKYVHTSEPSFFDVVSDPNEAHDLAGETDVAPYLSRITELAGRPRLVLAGVTPDEAMLDAIQKLGYAGLGEIGDGLPEPLAETDLPSPQSRASFFRRQAQAQELRLRDDIDGASAIYEEILQENGRNFVVLDELASLRMQGGRPAEAAEIMRRIVQDGPQEGRSYFKLGQCLVATEETGEAVDAFARALELSDGRKRYLDRLVEILRREGREEEARDTLRRYGRRP